MAVGINPTKAQEAKARTEAMFKGERGIESQAATGQQSAKSKEVGAQATPAEARLDHLGGCVS